MISKLDHTSVETAEHIRAVFQLSYAVEAKLLKAENFPPLKRKLNEFVASETIFYGYRKTEFLAAVIEIKERDNSIHIQSLVVDPAYFRKGLASELIQYVLQNHPSEIVTVETGLANEPAKQLYRSFGFTDTKEWDTDHGVRKIAFELKRKSS